MGLEDRLPRLTWLHAFLSVESHLFSEREMMCKGCGSQQLSKMGSELCVHPGGPRELRQPPELMFPTLTVCLGCGFVEFRMDESELRLLNEKMVA